MIERIVKCIDDESFKFRALSAGAVMAFDGQTDQFTPVEPTDFSYLLTLAGESARLQAVRHRVCRRL
jgi:hypothetical protein